MKGRGPSLWEQFQWWLATDAELRLNFCRECRVPFPVRGMEQCSNCGARVNPNATPSGENPRR
jgi:hypothetical protein